MQRHRPMSGLWFWSAGIGLVIFVLIQVFPIFSGPETGGQQTLSRNEAEQLAADVAADRFGIHAEQVDIEITYLSDSAASGYLARYALFEPYRKTWDASYPVDTYRADLVMRDGSGALILYLHPETGKLVGWQSSVAQVSVSEESGGDPAGDSDDTLDYASQWGVQPEDWIWDGQAPDVQDGYTFQSRQGGVGDAELLLHVRLPYSGEAGHTSSAAFDWAGGSLTYDILVPEGFADYLMRQNKLAGKLNAFGFVVPQLLLMIMAIVYAVTRKSYTSSRRGMALAALFWAMYAAFYFNLVPGFRAGLMEDGAVADSSAIQSLLVVNLIILAIMALFTYLAAVGGDGLWKSMGRSLWPRWREADYGREVVAGMKSGYLLAFLLLGVQSVILLGLGQGIGMFQTSDASQSTYNMTVPWLLLLLAWCAGISEEIQSRLFGIGLFRHWLVGGAKRMLGRAPSPRSAALLTAMAMFPPGLFWAFGHVSYAVYPVYSRLIELVIMAMLFGWFMLRFGFLTVLFAHIILDSILMSVQLMFDGSPGDLAAGVLGPILPAVVAWLIGWLHRRRADRRGMAIRET